MTFTYALPSGCIAQRPVHPPESAKLLIADCKSRTLSDSTFAGIHNLFHERDLIVFNNSKVMPSRLFGKLEGGNECEVLLLKEEGRDLWRAMGKPLKRFKDGRKIIFSETLSATVMNRDEDTVVLKCETTEDCTTRDAIIKTGLMPIPPYIRGGHSDEQDKKDYQTIFAKVDGSIAAPTASLHFSETLMQAIEARGVIKKEVTLHVGAPSFLALHRSGEEELIPPGREEYCYSQAIVDTVSETKKAGNRVIAVGTTVVRALESMMINPEKIDGKFYDTELFIQPGFIWRAVDALVTNFHQPDTTHLLLVESFMGAELLKKSYEHALEHEYRFLSYGDGMIIY